MTGAYLSRIETGERRPSPDVLEHIASRLHLDVDELLVDHVDGEAEAAARVVAGAVSRWLRNPGDVSNYDDLVQAVRRWEETSGG